MSSRMFRVDKDSEGNTEVSPQRRRKLRPLEDDNEPPVRGALKTSKSNPQDPSDVPVDASPKRKFSPSQPPVQKAIPSPPLTSEPVPLTPLSGKGNSAAVRPTSKQTPANAEARAAPAPEPAESPARATPNSEPEPVPPVVSSSETQPKSALKSALKGQPETKPAPKSALKSALKRPATASEPEQLQPTPPTTRPPTNPAPAKSALRKRPQPPAPQADVADAVRTDAVSPAQSSTAPVKHLTRSNSSVWRQRRDAPASLLRMRSEDLAEWTLESVRLHLYARAAQMMLWEEQEHAEPPRPRKSIRLEDLSKPGDLNAASGRQSLRKSHLILLEEKSEACATCSSIPKAVEISPLKDELLEKKPNEGNVRAILEALGAEGCRKWIDAPLDSTPPPMPSPLFHSVAAVHAGLVAILIEFKADVKQVYGGKSMLKGWIKPQVPLLDCVRSRMGRFVGTMLGEKLGKIENVLLSAGRQDTEPPVAKEVSKARRKSFQVASSIGLMEHTHGHPNTKYDLMDSFCDSSLRSMREATDADTGDSYAIKAGSKFYEAAGRDPEADLWNEIGILRKLNHPNVLQLHETFEDETHIFMVFELCCGGDLFDRLLAVGALDEPVAMRYCFQIGSAIQHLHGHMVCHRDIQPEHFLVVHQGPVETNSLKLGDFTMSKEFGSQPLLTKVCSLQYVAPEVLVSTEGYGERVDMWSFGVVLYVMLSGLLPFDLGEDLLSLKAVKSGSYTFEPVEKWREVSKESQQFIEALLVLDPAQRLDANAAMEHPAVVKAKELGADTSEIRREAVARSEVRKTGDTSMTMRRCFTLLAEKITNEQFQEMRDLFRKLDPTGSGMVEFGELRTHIQNMVDDMETASELKEAILNVVGKVNYTMYLATMTDWRRNIRREAARAIFSMFDIDKNGNISMYEIAQALRKGDCGVDLTKKKDVSKEEVSKIWQEMRQTFGEQVLEDKEMDFDEFFRELHKSTQDVIF
eukprot:TRINITY_DN74922_c0_g1_i1.p1 TRINITY_DN74922_c0_g1~~TRINITY_DN74922_c0_g1_i1.p1  ORF type:complete len:998 (+),score=197.89 TRINITY_DN74922_c0_g1_i1:62-2995(+)